MEDYAELKARVERVSRALHRLDRRVSLPDAEQRTLRAHPSWWRVYKRALGHGAVPPFAQGPIRLRTAEAQRAWASIERLARRRVLQSREVLTLYDAVQAVVRAHPELYEACARARGVA
jgi:hypothetical protein